MPIVLIMLMAITLLLMSALMRDMKMRERWRVVYVYDKDASMFSGVYYHAIVVACVVV